MAGQQALVDVNALDAEDVPLLHWASINDRRGIVKYLLKQVSSRTSDGTHKAARLSFVNSSDEKNCTIGSRDTEAAPRVRYASSTENTTRQRRDIFNGTSTGCTSLFVLAVGGGDARHSNHSSVQSFNI